MKFKKGLMFIAAMLLLAAVLGACAQQQPEQPEKSEWSIEIVGADKPEFTSGDYLKLDKVTIDTVLKKKDKTEVKQTWEGVLLKDVLDQLGVAEYTSVILEASDGYASEYTPDIVSDDKTILAVKSDGKPLGDDGPVESVAGNQFGNMWVRNLIKITVNK